ncbi:MAG: HNH endonuclease [Oscillospiraceae bacterium]|nr:HNH endonuclease [Oscillospiraceae bacterium]
MSSNNNADGWRFKKGNPEYDRYIHSAAWRQIADRRLEQDNYTCCVCGKPATEVHHLTYEHFGNEQLDDLVSLCHRCHIEAENLYDPAITPWAMNEVKPGGNNFMAAMRADAYQVAPVVFEYLVEVRGKDFDSLMRLRQPADKEGKKYWSVLKKAVNALCRKRYSMSCVEDRRAMMLETLTNHIEVICLSQIEHSVRNAVQSSLHDVVTTDYALFGTWKSVSEELGLSSGTVQKLRSDDGTSFGPSLRETVLYYCGLDAVAGIRPIVGFSCLSDADYKVLNSMADYMTEVSGDGSFKGEYIREDAKDA